MLHRFLVPASLCLISLVGLSSIARSADEPASMPATTQALSITVDVSKAPDLKDFADRCIAACEKVYPQFCEDLSSDGFVAPHQVTMTFSPDFQGVAATGGTHISCSADYFRAHQDDVGALVHELVHVIQHYRRGNPGWLVEGIADYQRFYRWEPTRRPHPTTSSSYRQGYQTTAAFLDSMSRKYDAELVKKLNAACREGRDAMQVLQTATGKSVDELWTEFDATLPPGPAAGPTVRPPTTRRGNRPSTRPTSRPTTTP